MRFYRESAKIGVAALLVVALLCGCKPSLPAAPRSATAEERTQQAHSFIDAMKPRRSGKPLVAVVASNSGTETTDFLLTHAVLQRAGVADVQAVAPQIGRVALYPALQAYVAQDLAGFDRAHPRGADYVIVPAISDPDDPAITEWLKAQAARGARIVGICAGARVVANAGLLDHRRFTTHWYYRDEILERQPSAIHVPHQRYVVDGDIATTTGISASIPTMLALVEAMSGPAKAQAIASELGVDSWTPEHDSSLFGLSAGRAASYALNKAAFWRNEQWRVDVRDGMDDIPLALASDAWSRTGHVEVLAAAPRTVTLRSGMVIDARPLAKLHSLPLAESLNPMQQLARTLCEIEDRFGAPRRQWVMTELEYAATISCKR
jgi:putative intracellular protease/amidase